MYQKTFIYDIIYVELGHRHKCPANDQLDNYTNYQTMTCLSVYEKNEHLQS